jgi:ABC-2 type transport system permease protein
VIFKSTNPASGMDFHYGHLVYLPVIMASQFALCLGVSLVVSCANVFFRDTEHIMTMVMLAWFFLTPIFYEIDDIPKTIAGLDVQRLSFLNPMTGIVTAYRHVLMRTDIIAPQLVVMSHLVCWLIFIFGLAFFNRVQTKFADAL